MATPKSFYDLEEKNIKGIPVKFSEYKGKVVLIVNVASKCGYTKQYKPLQDLYKNYKSEGFEILGFPCDEFANQEPGKIEAFACGTHKVTFPLFQKIKVKGSDASPVYQFLKSHNPGEIKWNFEKFVIDRKGNVRGRYSSGDVPGIKDASTLLFDVIKETSILQAIIIIALEVRVYLRNVEAESKVNDLKNNLPTGNNTNCQLDPSILQWLEVKKWYNDLSDACPNEINEINFSKRFFGYDLPLVIALLLFALIMSLLCYELYHIYGWFTYKTIGADVKIQRVYITYTRFIMILKLDWFFMFGFAIESCKIYVDRMQDLSNAKKEWKIGSYISCAFWVICIIDFCILLYFSIGTVNDSWYFFIIYDIVAIIFASVSIIWNILVILNFGFKIQDKIDKKEKRNSILFLHDDESGEKFTIDD
ncbi:7442_t:CDS:10 [Diversispora eburnea]|uniref:Glutathione peroxidase n=1 Tax=Diversispora eburnea TaxID=1213867 RepID=A0A9N9G619_9GLOM|nr:7442_t:CDS:10 [Diversispora eburnea]